MTPITSTDLRQLAEESLAMVALSKRQAAYLGERLALLEPQPIETAPKTSDDFKECHYLLGWCPDPDCTDGGEWRIVYWEPKMRRPRGRGLGIWYGDRDVQEHPTHWLPLPGPLKLVDPEQAQAA